MILRVADGQHVLRMKSLLSRVTNDIRNAMQEGLIRNIHDRHSPDLGKSNKRLLACLNCWLYSIRSFRR